jgi:hypothetical protein
MEKKITPEDRIRLRVRCGAFSMAEASHEAARRMINVAINAAMRLIDEQSPKILPALAGSLERNSAIYLVAATHVAIWPRPAKKRTVFWIIPNSPKTCRPRIFAMTTLAKKTLPWVKTELTMFQLMPLANRARMLSRGKSK